MELILKPGFLTKLIMLCRFGSNTWRSWTVSWLGSMGGWNSSWSFILYNQPTSSFMQVLVGIVPGVLYFKICQLLALDRYRLE